jgi:hypothetical protein
VIVAGGEQASTVTLTRSDTTQFRVRFFHKIFEEELGSIMGHFGPVHALSFSPDGRRYCLFSSKNIQKSFVNHSLISLFQFCEWCRRWLCSFASL